MATYAELIAKSKELAAAGDMAGAKRVAEIALRQRDAAPKSWGQSTKEFFLGDDDPNTQNMGEKIGSFLNKGGEAMTMGLVGDEASAAVESMIPGFNYEDRRDHYRGQEEVLERDNPGAALTADIGGSVLGALTPMGKIGTLAKGAGIVPRVAASVAAGAGMGGTYGAMEGEDLDSRLSGGATGAAVGGAAGLAAPMIGAGVQKIADGRAVNRAIKEAIVDAPTTAAQRAQGTALYGAIDDAGVQIKPDRVRAAMDDITTQLRSEGAGYTGAERVLPSSVAVMESASDVAKGANSVPFKELDMFRRFVGNAAGRDLSNKGDTRAVSGVVDSLNDFVQNLTEADVDAGDIKALQTLLPKAKDVWARMSRSQLLDDAIDAGENNYRTGAASGMRAQFQRIVNNPKLLRGFSEAEIKMMRRVVSGTLPEQLLNYAGSGLGMVAQGAVGGMLGGIPGIIAGGAIGAAARKGSESVVRRNAEIARALVASGKVPQLPVASDTVRKVTEALMRRTGAAVPQ